VPAGDCKRMFMQYPFARLPLPSHQAR
jgi:hypothetical protein